MYLANPFSLPLIFTIGASSEIYHSDEHSVLVAADFISHSDVPEEFALGAEYTWNDIISFRSGYIFGQDQQGFSAGIGLKYISGGFGGVIDYSISPTLNLGLVNRLSVNLNFK